MKTAFITGGSSGIGLATARRFLHEGLQVAVFARSGDRLARARDVLGDRGLALAGDVRSPAEVELALATARERLGPVDILVTAAGITDAGHISELAPARYDDLMDTNVRGTVFAVRHALPHLAEGASIILVGSVAGAKGQPGDALYAGTKGFVRAFARSLGTDPALVKRGIRTNCVSPGPVDTPLTHDVFHQPGVKEYVEQLVPLGRWAQPDELANAIWFLASPMSSFMTGADLRVDGGMSHA